MTESTSKIKAGIVGGAGYTGGEMLRILINHPNVEIIFVHSNSNAGNHVYDVHADLFAVLGSRSTIWRQVRRRPAQELLS